MDPAECEKRIGSTLAGKWRLERLLGVGGMAAVYVALHRVGRRETIKILHPEAARNPTLRGRLEREARAANMVEHPAVVPIRDVDVAPDGCPFLVMDFVEGETLSARLARDGSVRWDVLAPWVDDVLGALEKAHACGIVHRDIKPENLMIQPDGRIRVLDFGIAKVTRGESDGVHTETGVTLGTASYMPPEQIRGAEIDGRADLFALAATMFRALAGRHIHGKLVSEGDLLVRMATERAPLLAGVAPEVPAGVAQVVDLCLELDARRRYPDAATMRADLAAAREGTPPPFAALTAADRERRMEALGPVTAPIPVPSVWDEVHAPAAPEPAAPALVATRAQTPVSMDARPSPPPAARASTASALATTGRSSAVKTVPASSRRWAPIGRVVYAIGGALTAGFGLLLWIAFVDAKTKTTTVYVLLMLLATFPLVVGALLFWRAVTAHRTMRRPTEEAMRAVLASAFASDARTSPAELAAKSALPVEDVSQALDALVSVGSARREVSEDGYVLYAFARTDRARP